MVGDPGDQADQGRVARRRAAGRLQPLVPGCQTGVQTAPLGQRQHFVDRVAHQCVGKGVDRVGVRVRVRASSVLPRSLVCAGQQQAACDQVGHAAGKVLPLRLAWVRAGDRGCGWGNG